MLLPDPAGGTVSGALLSSSCTLLYSKLYRLLNDLRMSDDLWAPETSCSYATSAAPVITLRMEIRAVELTKTRYNQPSRAGSGS